MTLYMKMQEAYEEGYKKGLEIGTLLVLVSEGLLEASVAADRLNMTVEEFQALLTSHFPPK